jgi:signal recognition particle GTPase
MLRIFRKNKKKPGELQDVQLRPAEQSGQDALEARLEDTRRQLGKRLGSLLSSRSAIDEDLLDEIETTLITAPWPGGSLPSQARFYLRYRPSCLS